MDQDVKAYLEAVATSKRRQDADRLLQLMAHATGQQPRMWGSLVGFGSYRYRYRSGREGDAPAASFAARKAASTVYLPDGVEAHADSLARLGPHTTGKGCLHIKNVEAVDSEVLETIVARSYEAAAAGGYVGQEGEGTP
jgi:hypothetical protein